MSDWRATARQRVPRLAPQLYSAAVRRARFTVVPRQEVRAPRAPFVALVATVLLAGVVGLLLFNTHMQQGSFRATALEAQATRLHATQQSLEMELDRLRDPQEVALRAQRLGMVPLADPAFLSLADGRTLGVVRPASREDAQRLTPLPTRRPADYRHPVRRIPWDAEEGSGGAGTAGTVPSTGTDAGTATGATAEQ
jgi:cell division protein FtsB